MKEHYAGCKRIAGVLIDDIEYTIWRDLIHKHYLVSKPGKHSFLYDSKIELYNDVRNDTVNWCDEDKVRAKLAEMEAK
jgi:hypothetical protein